MNTAYQEQENLQNYIDRLSGEVWKALALAQYRKSRQEELTHREAMITVYNLVIKTSSTVLKPETAQQRAKGCEHAM